MRALQVLGVGAVAWFMATGHGNASPIHSRVRSTLPAARCHLDSPGELACFTWYCVARGNVDRTSVPGLGTA